MLIEMEGRSGEEDYCHQLPPGFRFHPTDEEIIMHYLLKKVIDRKFTAIAIGEADFNKCEPWDLPKKAKMGEREWFLFCQRDRKYPTGMRTNRATERGYWKATGKDKEIYTKTTNLVGMKKTLVFYQGRAPKGDKSNWVMHEYRLEGNFSSYNFSRAAKESWVVCKVFHKSISGVKTSTGGMDPFMIHLQNDIPTLPSPTECSTSHQRPSNSCFATDYHKSEIKPNIYSNNYELQSDNHHQKTFFVPPDDNYDPNPIVFPSNLAVLLHYQASSVGYQCQGGSTGPSSIYPFKRIDQVNSRPDAPNIVIKENISSNSMVSHSHDTRISTEMANEITSMPSENKKQFDQELIEGLAFSPNMSDLDSLWSY